MSTIDEVLMSMSNEVAVTDEVLVIDPSTRQINVPGSELVFGVEADAGSERKQFQCPRYVGNNVDLAASFLRVNFRNANGEMDSYLVEDVRVVGDDVVFSWVLSPKAVRYKGQTKFVICVVGADLKLAWHTTLATGIVLEGLEPTNAHVTNETSDVVAQLIAMVEAQTAAVEKVGGEQVAVVKAAAEAAEAASVAQIEAKGASTLATIPDDYTAVQNAVRGAANAIRGKASGEVIRVDDVSPMEHYPVVKVSGKNLVGVEDVTITDFTGYHSPIPLNFEVEVGKTYTLSMDIQSNVEPFITSVGLGTETAYHKDTGYGNSQNSGHTVITFTPTEKGISNGKYLHIRAPRYTTSTTFSATISNIQLEEGEVATEYTPYIDPTTVTVTRCGKNIIPHPYTNSYATLHGLTYSDGGNGVVKVAGTTTQGTNFFFAMHQRIKAGTYTLSGMANLSGMIALIYDDATKTTLAKLNGGVDSVTFTIDADAIDCNIYLNQAYANKEVSGYVRLQLELANTATKYEPYNGETQIPAADGTVSGLAAVSPTMTLLTNTPGVNIECEYSRDTNKVIAELLDKITALGG